MCDRACRDIESRADCERLVRAFYGRALEDPIIGFIFVDVAKLDLEAHVPRLTSFWETILLGAQSYGGGAFRPHAQLHGRSGCAEGTSSGGWRSGAARSTSCSPATAPSWRRRTPLRVARAFHQRLEEMPSAGRCAAPPGGLTVTQHG